MLKEVISSRLLDELKYAKYGDWSCEISKESFEMLLRAIDAFATEFTRTRAENSPFPSARYALTIDNVRLIRALEELIILRKTLKARDYLEVRAQLSKTKGKAFSADFNKHLQGGDAGINWASGFSDYQLYLLLWYVGEYACRVFTDDESDSDNEYKCILNLFDLSAASDAIMINSMKTIVKVFRSGLCE